MDVEDVSSREIGPEEIHSVRHVRHRLLADPYRPTYHFVAPEGLAAPFDPNGNIYWNGRHHMGYIYQERGLHCWGHVSSTDLLHWRHHPPWLLPTLDSPEKGIFSGNAYLDRDGRRALCLYHGLGAGNCMAWSDDINLERWHKQKGNPIVPNPDDEEKADYTSWDPCGWIDGDTYYAVFGGKKNTVWKSRDLRSWTMCGPFLASPYPGIDIFEDISCPDFCRLGDKWVMVCISHRLGARYYVGRWAGEQLHPEYHEMMSFCDNEFFAPESHTDGRGRRILFAWVFDGRQEAARVSTGWCGTMSLPRVMTLGPDGRILMEPAEELVTLRYNPRRFSGVKTGTGDETVVDFTAVEANVYELEAELQTAGADEVGIKVGCSSDGREETVIGYDVAAARLRIDTTRTGVNQRKKAVEAAPLKLAAGEPLRLRVFADRSIVEVFANDGQRALCRTIYPSTRSTGIRLYARGGAAGASSVTAWDMMPTNPY